MLSPHNTLYGHILSSELTNSPSFVRNADSENFYDLHRDSSLEIYLLTQLRELLMAISSTHSERFSLQKIVMKTSGGDINQGEHPEVCYTNCCTLSSISFLPHQVFSKQVFNDATNISHVVFKGECYKINEAHIGKIRWELVEIKLVGISQKMG